MRARVGEMSWKEPSRMAESIRCSRYSASTSEIAAWVRESSSR